MNVSIADVGDVVADFFLETIDIDEKSDYNFSFYCTALIKSYASKTELNSDKNKIDKILSFRMNRVNFLVRRLPVVRNNVRRFTTIDKTEMQNMITKSQVFVFDVR